jgi:hypothetical protein
VASGKPNEYILQASLPSCQVEQLCSLVLDCIQQSWDRQVRLAHIERNQAIVSPHRLDAHECRPDINRLRIAGAVY